MKKIKKMKSKSNLNIVQISGVISIDHKGIVPRFQIDVRQSGFINLCLETIVKGRSRAKYNKGKDRSRKIFENIISFGEI